MRGKRLFAAMVAVAAVLALAVSAGATIKADPGSVDFGSVPAGSSASAFPNLEVTESEQYRKVVGTSFSPAGGPFSGGTNDCEVMRKETSGGTGTYHCTFALKFTPQGPGPVKGKLLIELMKESNSETTTEVILLTGSGPEAPVTTPPTNPVTTEPKNPAGNGKAKKKRCGAKKGKGKKKGHSKNRASASKKKGKGKKRCGGKKKGKGKK